MPQTADQIIAKAIREQPTVLMRSLAEQATEHAVYAFENPRSAGRRGALASRRACVHAQAWVQRLDLTPEERALAICTDGVGTMVVALNAACKLLNIPAHERTAAAVAWDAAHTEGGV